MAKRRKGTKGKAGRQAPARRTARRSPGKRTRGRTADTRQARPAAAAREARPRAAASRAAARHPALRLADPPLGAAGPGRAVAEDREAAELARRIEATVGGAEASLRPGPARAPDQLRAHREQMEEAARRHEEARDLPGAFSLGLDLAAGALKLAGAVAAAPIRLGLAFFRRGDPSG